MKASANHPVPVLFHAVAAGVIAVAFSGCGDESPPKPAAKAPPPPAQAAPKAEAKAAPDKPAAESGQAAADKALAARVKSALSAEPLLNAHGMDIVVKDGAVTLFGTADSRVKREMAGKIAAAVAGVKSVDNKLAVVAGS